jgi:hypothetical protein
MLIRDTSDVAGILCDPVNRQITSEKLIGFTFFQGGFNLSNPDFLQTGEEIFRQNVHDVHNSALYKTIC